jgi:AsmA protein
MKKILLAIGILLIVGLVLIVLLPFIVDLNSYQAQYRPVIEEALNRKVTLKDIRLTIIPRIGVRIAGFTVMDDPAFGAQPFASLSSLDIGVKLRPLLQKRVEVEEITLRDPIITVIKNSQGVLNTATLGKKGPPKPEPQAAPSAEGPLHVLTMLAVDQVSITGGKLSYSDQSSPKPTDYVLEKLQFLLKGVGLGRTPTLHMATTIQPYNLPLGIDGRFGPLKETLDLETIDMAIALGKISLAVKGSDIGGNLKVGITSPVINTADLPMALPLKKPVEVKDLKIVTEVRGPHTKLENLSLNVFGGQLAAQGDLTSGPKSPPFDGKVALHGVQLGPLMEAVGTETVSISGTAAMDLNVRGAGFSMPEITDALQGTGHFVAKDGKIEGVNLLKEAFALLKAVGIKEDLANATVFSTIESNVGIKHGIITVERLLMDSHDFQATATGTVGFDKVLNLKVNLNLTEAISQSIAGGSPMAKMAMTGGRNSVPMVITGTAQAPSYSLDTKALGSKAQEQIKEQVKEKAAEFLKGKSGGGGAIEKGEGTLKKLFGQ